MPDIERAITDVAIGFARIPPAAPRDWQLLERLELGYETFRQSEIRPVLRTNMSQAALKSC